MELTDLGDIARDSQFKVFNNAIASGGQVKAICAPGCAAYSRKEVEALTELVKRFGARGLATFALGESEIKSQRRQVFHARANGRNLRPYAAPKPAIW